MSVELVTGFAGYNEKGEPNRHVSSSDDGMRQYGTIGPGMYVLETASMLSAELESANSLVMQPGDLLINGRHVRCPDATVFSIPVGTQGMMTSNLCVIRYKRVAGDVESAEALVLTGEPSASDPQDPAVSSGDIADGAEQVDFPLYRVVTNGIESEDPVALFRTIPPLVDVADDLEAFKAPGAIKAENLAADSVTADKIASGAVGTSEIKDDAVTAAKIATNAVTADGIAAGAVGSSELASNAVQTAKIAANAVTSDKLAQAVRDSISHKLLWSGSFKSGSITVSGLSSYRVLIFEVLIVDRYVAVQASYTDDLLVGGGSIGGASVGVIRHVGINLRRSGDKLTWLGAHSAQAVDTNVPLDGVEYAYDTRPITRIYGLIPA